VAAGDHGDGAGFFETAVESSAVAFVVVAADALVRYHTPAAADMLRGLGTDLVDELFPALFTVDARETVDAYLRMLAAQTRERTVSAEAHLTLADGDERSIEITGVNLLDVPEVRGMVLSLYDATEHRRALRSTAVDLLTGLGTRHAFEAKLDATPTTTLILIDLDRFKDVNDRFGHAFGDEVLASVARRLQNLFGMTGSVYRVGGDEFALLLPRWDSPELRVMTENALVAMSSPIGAPGVTLTACAGIAHPDAGEGADLVSRANRALLRAKTGGPGSVVFDDGEEHDWETRRQSEKSALAASRRREDSLKAAIARLVGEKRTDDRTTLLSAAAFDEDIIAIDKLAQYGGERYAIALCDIDYFGRYNNRYLYENGNTVLRRVADALRSACRPGDLVYRYGGEELAVVLPDTQLRDAARLAERFRSAVEALGIPHEDRPQPHRVTISVGVAAFEEDRDGVTDVFGNANARLRVAKDGGKNRVDPPPSLD
jgi:diguanylate cyclase (GGDEF)-like protein/PAS domain S-box-containing protein